MKKCILGIIGILFLTASGCTTTNTNSVPQPPQLSGNEEAMASFNRGVTYSKAGLYEDAVKDFSQAIEKDPGFVEAYYNRGHLLGRLGKPQEAIQDFTKVISLNPRNPYAYTDRGVAYGSLGKTDLAIQDFTRAIALKPDLAAAYYNRAVGYLREKKCAEARKDLSKAQDLGFTGIRQGFLDEVNKACPENQ